MTIKCKLDLNIRYVVPPINLEHPNTECAGPFFDYLVFGLW